MIKVCGMVFAVMITLGSYSACAGEEHVISNGIRFEIGSSWKHVLSMAKMEHKYIFVDCYATWCGPCKEMDKEVYASPDLGEKFNDHFISIRVQMDSSTKDNDQTRSFYPDAHYLGLRYKIGAYPTLLFFNSDGKILRRSVGAMSTMQFMKLAEDVQDTNQDYYAILESYKGGKRDIVEMSYLARTAESLLGDTVEANQIAHDYMQLLKKGEWFTKANIEFMRQFTSSSKDQGFSFFYKHAALIDKVMGDRTYAQGVVVGIIYREDVLPEVRSAKKNGTTPDWTSIGDSISKKYDDIYSQEVISSARSSWGFRHNDWKEFIKYRILFVEKFGPEMDTGGSLQALYYNNNAWYIFLHSADTAELQIALKWSRSAVLMDPNPNWMDTYANILYRLNRREAAIRWETVAAALANKSRIILETLAKMKEGRMTWPPNL